MYLYMYMYMYHGFFKLFRLFLVVLMDTNIRNTQRLLSQGHFNRALAPGTGQLGDSLSQWISYDLLKLTFLELIGILVGYSQLVIILTDELIFFRGVGLPPASIS